MKVLRPLHSDPAGQSWQFWQPLMRPALRPYRMRRVHVLERADNGPQPEWVDRRLLGATEDMPETL